MKRIRRDDTVIVIAGKSKGHVGKVKKIVGTHLIVVDGANIVQKHVKPNPQINQTGGIKKIEAPLHISNVAIYNPQSSKADKVGFKYIERNGNTTKVRYFKSNNELVDIV